MGLHELTHHKLSDSSREWVALNDLIAKAQKINPRLQAATFVDDFRRLNVLTPWHESRAGIDFSLPSRNSNEAAVYGKPTREFVPADWAENVLRVLRAGGVAVHMPQYFHEHSWQKSSCSGLEEASFCVDVGDQYGQPIAVLDKAGKAIRVPKISPTMRVGLNPPEWWRELRSPRRL